EGEAVLLGQLHEPAECDVLVVAAREWCGGLRRRWPRPDALAVHQPATPGEQVAKRGEGRGVVERLRLLGVRTPDLRRTDARHRVEGSGRLSRVTRLERRAVPEAAAYGVLPGRCQRRLVEVEADTAGLRRRLEDAEQQLAPAATHVEHGARGTLRQ